MCVVMRLPTGVQRLELSQTIAVPEQGSGIRHCWTRTAGDTQTLTGAQAASWEDRTYGSVCVCVCVCVCAWTHVHSYDRKVEQIAPMVSWGLDPNEGPGTP